MRTTKYEWVCLMRYARSGGYDPTTGDTKPIITQRQELWVKAYTRPEKTGNSFQQYVTDGLQTVYSENNYGVLYLKEIPIWPPMLDPYTGGRLYPVNVFCWWRVVRSQLDAEADTTRNNWVRVQGGANNTIGTRFNKFYDIKIARLSVLDEPFQGAPAGNLVGPPTTSPPATISFEQAEQRLRTVLSIADGELNK